MIISIANQKGGVGKTTLTVHTARWLANAGKKVVVVDADPQANSTTWVLDRTHDDLWQILVTGKKVSQAIHYANGDRWGFAIVAGDTRTGDAMAYLLAARKPFNYIHDALKPLDTISDYVLIDMPPSRATGFQELLFASRFVLVPTELERLSLDGIVYMAQTCVALTKQHGTGPQLLGIVPNKYRAKTREHNTQLQDLTAAFKSTVWPVIPLATAVPEACALGTTMFQHAPKNRATHQLAKVGLRLLDNTRGG